MSFIDRNPTNINEDTKDLSHGFAAGIIVNKPKQRICYEPGILTDTIYKSFSQITNEMIEEI